MDSSATAQTMAQLSQRDSDRPSLTPFVILETCKYLGSLLVLYVLSMFSLPYLRDGTNYLVWLFDPNSPITETDVESVVVNERTGFTEFVNQSGSNTANQNESLAKHQPSHVAEEQPRFRLAENNQIPPAIDQTKKNAENNSDPNENWERW